MQSKFCCVLNGLGFVCTVHCTSDSSNSSFVSMSRNGLVVSDLIYAKQILLCFNGVGLWVLYIRFRAEMVWWRVIYAKQILLCFNGIGLCVSYIRLEQFLVCLDERTWSDECKANFVVFNSVCFVCILL